MSSTDFSTKFFCLILSQELFVNRTLASQSNKSRKPSSPGLCLMRKLIFCRGSL